MGSLVRVILTLAGGVLAAFVIALAEARFVVSQGAARSPSGFALALADAGVLCPAVLVVGAAVALLSLVVEPSGSASILERMVALRASRVSRVRAAVVAPLLVGAVLLATLLAAHVARRIVGAGSPAESGLAMGLSAVGLAVFSFALGLALVPTLWRRLAKLPPASPWVDPLVTGGGALAVAAVLAVSGVVTGGANGNGGVPGVRILGVLARPELDLRPVFALALVAALSWLGGRLAWLRDARPSAVAAVLLVLAELGLCVRSSSSLADAPEVSEGIARHAPLGRLTLGALRRATDRDGDGYSARFGGADCDDRDRGINPTAIDVPGNGIDEDCSGADTPAIQAAAPERPAPATPPSRPRRGPFNVILVTVDTLRFDLGFNGYPKPVSPNLDALAARATVFERAYSLSSYTAKSIAPMLIGRYPSEAHRDYEHYTTYYPQNVFVAERLKAAGVHTFGGHCHYYFQWNTGLAQGFETWDTSAIAPGMADSDASITSDRLADLALRMLARPENVGDGSTGRRFFGWFHFFDPHAQYVKHPGAPDFRSLPGGQAGREIYDEEVWFTDKHIGRVLDYIASQPWGRETAVIVTADHGEAFGDHGVRTHGHELYEPLVRVPLIVYVPGAPARRIAVKRSAIDLAPTILDLLGAPAAGPGELRGESLLADVYASPGDALAERDVYLDMPEGPFNDVRRALLSGPSPGMKLLHFGGRRYELYDLSADPGELHNLAGDEARLAEAMDRMQRMRAGLSEISVTRAR